MIAYDKHSDELLLAEPLEGMEDELESRIQLMTSWASNYRILADIAGTLL